MEEIEEKKLVWMEKGGEVWERMATKAGIIAGGEDEKEGINNFVNTRIVDSKKRMEKRGRKEMLCH